MPYYTTWRSFLSHRSLELFARLMWSLGSWEIIFRAKTGASLTWVMRHLGPCQEWHSTEHSTEPESSTEHSAKCSFSRTSQSKCREAGERNRQTQGCTAASRLGTTDNSMALCCSRTGWIPQFEAEQECTSKLWQKWLFLDRMYLACLNWHWNLAHPWSQTPDGMHHTPLPWFLLYIVH